MAKILVVEDEAPLRELVRDLLVSENHEVDTAEDGVDGLNRIEHGQYDVAVIDWSLPGKDGVDICRSYRRSNGTARLLLLTGRSSYHDRIAGLDSGADDYLTKPFNSGELLARIRALLRRPGGLQTDLLTLGDLQIDVRGHSVKRGDSEIVLVRKEFAVLSFLAQNPDRVFTSDALLARVWPSDNDTSTDALATLISRLRKKIDKPGEPSMIKTIHGVVYKLSLTP